MKVTEHDFFHRKIHEEVKKHVPLPSCLHPVINAYVDLVFLSISPDEISELLGIEENDISKMGVLMGLPFEKGLNLEEDDFNSQFREAVVKEYEHFLPPISVERDMIQILWIDFKEECNEFPLDTQDLEQTLYVLGAVTCFENTLFWFLSILTENRYQESDQAIYLYPSLNGLLQQQQNLLTSCQLQSVLFEQC
jgi:hypothetical protein